MGPDCQCHAPRSRFSARVAVTILLSGLCGLRAAEPVPVAGVSKPFKEETLSSTVPGTVQRLLVKEGDHVEKGQLLIELDSKQEELEVARRKLLWESRAEVDSAAARVETFKADLDSTRKVFEATTSVSKEELLKKELEYKLAVAEFKRLEMVEEREKIEYDMASEQLQRRSIRAPDAGTVTKKLVEEGENCEPRQPLLKLVDISRCYFVANMDPKLASQLKLGQPVEVEVQTGAEGVVCKGSVYFISPVVDGASGLQEIKILFENADGRVRPGVAGTMKVAVSEHE